MDFELIESAGLKKIDGYTSNVKTFFVKSLIAGLYLGVATILAFTLGSMLYVMHPIAGSVGTAIFFGIAFVLIVFLNGELFTGNVFFTLFPVMSGKRKAMPLIPMWSLNYLGNALGAIFILVLFIYSDAQAKYVHDYVKLVTLGKLSYSVSSVFIKSILCNFIVVIAGYASVKVKEEMAKIVVMFLVVMTFVLPGLDHSIANIGVYAMGYVLEGMDVHLMQMIWYTFVSTIGNIIGGALLFAVPMYYILKPTKE